MDHELDMENQSYGEMDQTVQEFKDRYLIQGTETVSLKEALRRAPEDLIDIIWEKIVEVDKAQERAKSEGEEFGREKKEEVLYKAIQEDISANLLYMEWEQILLLLRVMNDDTIELEEVAEVIRDFVSRGWVSIFLEDDSCVFVVMDENRNIIRRMMEDPDQKEKMYFVTYVRNLVRACVGLYGVFRLEQLERIHRRLSIVEEETDSFMEKAAEVLPGLEKQGLFWMDDGYLVNPYFDTRRDYQELLKAQGGCDYYIPGEDTLLLYAEGNGVEKSPEYQAVHTCLARELRDADMAEEMLEELFAYIAMEDWGLPQIMNSFYQWDVTFENPKFKERLTKALSQWIYSIPRWSERGYSRKQRGKENEEDRYIYQVKPKPAVNAPAKVYPNDPCPCGSGRKYKKCCGR